MIQNRYMIWAIYGLTFAAIMVQLPTAAEVFGGTYNERMFNSPAVRQAQAIGYAAVFETSLLVFVLLRRTTYAALFAFFSLLTNLISHHVWEGLTAASPYIISLQLPVAIAIYSHELERLTTLINPGKVRPPGQILPEASGVAPKAAAPREPPFTLAAKPPAASAGPDITVADKSRREQGSGADAVGAVGDRAGSSGKPGLPATRENKCLQCQKTFYTVNAAKYCTAACRVKAHNARKNGQLV